MKEMNILYAIDEGKKDYSRYLGVSILSLLENNKDENVHIYILSKFEESNKEELIRIVNKYGKKISFSEGEIIPDRFKKVVYQGSKWPIAMYYRWFFSKCFDIKDRVLYLDCDTIVNKNLSEIYNLDFEGNVFIGKSDVFYTGYKQKNLLGLDEYINSGVLLINVDLFKEEELYQGVIDINKKYDKLYYPDQDCINLIYQGRIKINNRLQLIPCFNYFSNYSDYYVIHTTEKPNTGGLTYCPKKIVNLFNKYLGQTKWKTWLGYKKRITFREYGNYAYDFFKNYFCLFVADIFGEKIGFCIWNFFSNIGGSIGKILVNIGVFK